MRQALLFGGPTGFTPKSASQRTEWFGFSISYHSMDISLNSRERVNARRNVPSDIKARFYDVRAPSVPSVEMRFPWNKVTEFSPEYSFGCLIPLSIKSFAFLILCSQFCKILYFFYKLLSQVENRVLKYQCKFINNFYEISHKNDVFYDAQVYVRHNKNHFVFVL